MRMYILLLFMTLLGSVASIYLKKASAIGGFGKILSDRNIYVGGGLYLLSAILNIYLLRYLEYSVVLPMTALTYAWTMFGAFFVFGEKMTKKKIFGVVLIFVGGVCVSR